MAFYGIIDLHMHSSVSDGSDTPAEILSNVARAGIGLFSLTDHDAVKGCRIIRALLREGDPAFLCGAEFSCKDPLGKYHILGYRYDPDAEAMQSLVERSHSIRMTKVLARLDFIKSEFGFDFPEEEIKELLSLDNPGKPHIGKLMMKHGYAKSIRDAIHNYIDKIRVPIEFLRPEDAVSGILDSGGIPVLAHPFFGDGDQLIVGEEMEARLKRLMDFGLQGVEAFYSGFSPKLTEEMLGYASRYGLYVTAGSDYHGTNKLVQLGDTGMEKGAPLVPGMRRFFEAAEVNAANHSESKEM